MSTLRPKTVLSHYEIVSRLGAGGMGEVYEAYDRTLERRVAIKVLPLGRAPTEEALRRFTREAKAASSLNHPGIVTIHEIGQAEVEGEGKLDYIAMELVEGETLRRLMRRDLDIAKIADYLAQAAEALAKAHAAGLVHRDLKPENIMVTSDGFAKILDFGLAKSVEAQAATNDATAARDSITREGVMVGTLAYMSPEQVRGAAVDARSDIFALGCILYEAATRRHPFQSASAAEMLHRIAYEPPAPLADFTDLTPDLQRVIRKALAKDPDERYQSAKEMAIDLRDIRKQTDSTSSTVRLGPSDARRHRRISAAIAAGVAVLLIVAVAALWPRLRRRGGDDRHEAMTIERLPDTAHSESAAISPDGRYVADVESAPEGEAIFLRQQATGSRIVAAKPDGDEYTDLQFSPDGEFVRFRHRKQIAEVPVLGGDIRLLVDRDAVNAAFSPDGRRIAYTRDGSVFVADGDGSNEKRVAGGTVRDFYVQPSWSPKGELIACTRRAVATLTMWIEIIDPNSADPVAETAAHPRIVGDKRWFLFKSPAWLPDGSGIVVTAAPTIVAEKQLWIVDYPGGQMHHITNDLFNYDGASLSADASQLVSRQTDKRSRIVVSSIASPADAKTIVDGVAAVYSVDALGADSIIFSGRSGRNYAIWSCRMNGGDRKRLTDDAHNSSNPSLSPNGKTIAFVSDRSGAFGIWTMDVDGSNQRQITSGGWEMAPTFSPDGAWIVYTSRSQGKPVLWKIPTRGGSPVRLSSDFPRSGHLSPDGKLLAASDPHWKLALLDAADGKPLRVLSATYDGEVRWAADSKSLFFREGNAIYRLRVDAAAPEKIADFSPDELTAFDVVQNGSALITARTRYDVSIVLVRNFR